jgi:hypothetical protein
LHKVSFVDRSRGASDASPWKKLGAMPAVESGSPWTCSGEMPSNCFAQSAHRRAAGHELLVTDVCSDWLPLFAAYRNPALVHSSSI